MKVLIIEDEPLIAKELIFYINKIDPTLDILEVLDSVEESVIFLQANKPDLIFSDIHLADDICFKIFNLIPVICPIIFCTAYDEYAIEAFNTNGIAYILKPFGEHNIANALNKLKRLIPQNIKNAEPKEKIMLGGVDLEILTKILGTQKPYKSSFLVSKADKLIPIDIQNISFFYIKNEIVILYTIKGDNYVTNYTLDKLEEEINLKDFYRANRQFLISRFVIKEVQHYFARKLVVKLHTPTPEPIIVSKAKASAFTQWLDSSHIK